MRTVALYPYAVSDAVRLRLSDFDDPVTARQVCVHELGADTELDEGAAPFGCGSGYELSADQDWRKITFKLVAELAESELARVLPSTSEVSADTSLVVLVTCPSTRYRHGVRLRRRPDGRWAGHATIQRDDVWGSVLLKPQLVRTTGIPAREPLPYATKAGALVATGEVVTLHVDTRPKLGTNALVQIAWEDFANSDDAWRREHADDVYHLEPFGVGPHLWLNTRYGELRDLLESTAKRGPEALLRDTAAVLIAKPVLLQLSMAAIAALEIDDDSGSVTQPSGWRSDLIAAILPGLYPEEPGDDERLRRAAYEFRESDGAASLAARLGTVVQGMVTSYKTVESAVRAFEGIRDRDEANNG